MQAGASPRPDDGSDPTATGLTRRRLLGLGLAGVATAALGGCASTRSRPPARPAPPATTYGTVATMLAHPPFAVAHRGCSRSWPEMTAYAYARAVRDGFGALELSLQRTRDGVWFGMHDATLLRTSGVPARARDVLWADVARLRVRGSLAVEHPQSPPQPYLRLEEYLDRFYPGQVTFIDVKGNSARAAEVLHLLGRLPDRAQEHVVCKFYGSSDEAAGQESWARQAKAAGYHRWGYFTPADLPRFDRLQHLADLLGMTYNAGAAAWAQVLAPGKPVIAHIIDHPHQAAAALERGAAGLMVASAAALPPRAAARPLGVRPAASPSARRTPPP